MLDVTACGISGGTSPPPPIDHVKSLVTWLAGRVRLRNRHAVDIVLRSKTLHPTVCNQDRSRRARARQVHWVSYGSERPAWAGSPFVEGALPVEAGPSPREYDQGGTIIRATRRKQMRRKRRAAVRASSMRLFPEIRLVGGDYFFGIGTRGIAPSCIRRRRSGTSGKRFPMHGKLPATTAPPRICSPIIPSETYPPCGDPHIRSLVTKILPRAHTRQTSSYLAIYRSASTSLCTPGDRYIQGAIAGRNDRAEHHPSRR